MIHLRDDRYSLTYDLASDRGAIFFDRELLVAEWNGSGWSVIHGAGWLEMGTRREHDLRGRLHRIRALAGLATDMLGNFLRILALLELTFWDKWWRTERAKYLVLRERIGVPAECAGSALFED